MFFRRDRAISSELKFRADIGPGRNVCEQLLGMQKIHFLRIDIGVLCRVVAATVAVAVAVAGIPDASSTGELPRRDAVSAVGTPVLAVQVVAARISAGSASGWRLDAIRANNSARIEE